MFIDRFLKKEKISHSNYNELRKLLKQHHLPALLIDMDAFDSNIEWVINNCGNKSIRIATKSVRSLEMLKYILSYSDVFQGVMCFSIAEALWLRKNGIDDILVGYPDLNRGDLELLANDPRGISLMVDLPEHLRVLNQVAKHRPINICLDIDLSLDLPGIRFGVYRSAIRGQDDLVKFLSVLSGCSKLRLKGLMGYEAQVAGLGDKKKPLIRGLKNLSNIHYSWLRSRAVKFLKDQGHIVEFVNGGGTGSLKRTTKESVVTEVTVGSAFYAPALFDFHQEVELSPAMMFALPIVRKPTKDIYTCSGGGYIASGSLSKASQPVPFLPQSIELTYHEGLGEVQTPLKYTGNIDVGIGDPVFFRAPKAGEICERFNEIALIRKNKIEKIVKTYRGEGRCFL